MNPPYPDMAPLLEWCEAAGEGKGVWGIWTQGLQDIKLFARLDGWSVRTIYKWNGAGYQLCVCIAGGQGWVSQKRLLYAEDFRKPATQDGTPEIYSISGDSL